MGYLWCKFGIYTSISGFVAKFISTNIKLKKLLLLIFADACLRCQAENRSDKEQEECVVIWGECNHSFHNCCMKLWVKQNNRCPLCQQEWSVQRIGKWSGRATFAKHANSQVSTILQFHMKLNRIKSQAHTNVDHCYWIVSCSIHYTY